MSFEIIDFHTHPFLETNTNICAHKEFCGMNPENTRKVFEKLVFRVFAVRLFP